MKDDAEVAALVQKYERRIGHDKMKVRCGKCGRPLKLRIPGEPEPQRFRPSTSPASHLADADSVGAWQMTCHRRCGADWRRASGRMAAALFAARKAGKREVVVGVDV